MWFIAWEEISDWNKNEMKATTGKTKCFILIIIEIIKKTRQKKKNQKNPTSIEGEELSIVIN